jgi:hypothetical protein
MTKMTDETIRRQQSVIDNLNESDFERIKQWKLADLFEVLMYKQKALFWESVAIALSCLDRRSTSGLRMSRFFPR